MSLVNMKWTRVTVHNVVAEFLQSERWKPAGVLAPQCMNAVDTPNTSDPVENHLRLRLLYYFRCFLFAEIPPDTEWFEVRYLTDNELNQLRVVGRCSWDDRADQNELAKVAARRPEKLNSPPTSWGRLILWGHDRQGPFTILEGNHRLVAYASTSPLPGLSIAVLVGLSPTPCFFHILDPPRVIANDLWKTQRPNFWY
jgi:hypothetical protein